MTVKEFGELKTLLFKMYELIHAYGENEYNIQKKMILDIIKCIESDMNSNEKKNYIVCAYKNLFPPRGGLSEFYIENENFDTRVLLNKPIDEIKENLWHIMKKYV